MKLSIINGSPRGRSSNTKIITDKVMEGFKSVDDTFKIEEFFLASKKDQIEAIIALENSDIVLIGFPLYTDAMPGIVKEFFETIDLQQFDNKKLKLGFIVQSGFPESYQSNFLKKYLDKLAQRLEVDYLGTVIKGGVEGIKIQPKWMTRFLDLFYDLGQHLALEWEFDQKIINRLAKPDHLKSTRLFFFKLMMKTGLSNFYWNKQLKENNAYDLRFAKPYTE